MKKKYKILYFDLQIPYLLGKVPTPVGGAAVEWVTWLKAFTDIGCDSGLLTWKGAKDIISSTINFDVIESYHQEKGIPKLRLFTYQLPILIWKTFLYKPDFIVQECANRFTGILSIIAKILGVKFIHRIASDMDVDGRIEKNITGMYLKLYYYGVKNADMISCQNNYQFEILSKKFPNKKISIHYNPFEMKESIDYSGEKKYIAWVGNFRYEKNLPALLSIAKSLCDFEFKIAGLQLEYNDLETNEAVKELNTLNNVEFIGHVKNEDITNFLGKAYCLLNTSRLEGFSNTFLEAWSVGTPVITTINVNPDQIISTHSLGIVADDYEKLPDLIEEFIKDKNYLNLEEQCKNYIMKFHAPKILANNFLNDMKSLKNK